MQSVVNARCLSKKKGLGKNGLGFPIPGAMSISTLGRARGVVTARPGRGCHFAKPDLSRFLPERKTHVDGGWYEGLEMNTIGCCWPHAPDSTTRLHGGDYLGRIRLPDYANENRCARPPHSVDTAARIGYYGSAHGGWFALAPRAGLTNDEGAMMMVVVGGRADTLIRRKRNDPALPLDDFLRSFLGPA